MAGVSLDFALNVRRSPVSLLQIRQQVWALAGVYLGGAVGGRLSCHWSE